MMLCTAIVALLAAASSVSSAATVYPTFNLIKDDRDAGRFVFMPNTPAQREVVLSNAESILNVWVSRDSKIKNYGKAADPTPIMKDLRKRIASITDEELQQSLNDAFIMIRDQHTRFFKPAPYRCFFATTGLSYQLVEGDPDIRHKPKVVVSDITTIPDILKLMGKDYAKIKLGDELHTIDGKSFVEWFTENQFKAGDGANDFGGQRTTLDFLGTIYGSINRLPTNDHITLQFKARAKYNRIYTVKVPYVSGHNNACWTLSSNMYKGLTNITLPGTPILPSHMMPTHHDYERQLQIDAIREKKFPKGKQINHEEFTEARNSIFPQKADAALAFHPANVTTVSYAIWKPKTKNLGIIRLDDFEPKDPKTGQDAVPQAVRNIRDLLTTVLKDTKAVVLDIRSNPGGIIYLANAIPQFFKPDYEPYGFRYLMNNMTYNIFVNGSDPADPFSKLWFSTKPGSRYTDTALLDPAESYNTYGQVYVRPMAIFNNGECYSACDMLSANIQDSATGTIFGEDGQTGAGGANVFQLNPYLMQIDPTDFKMFPFTKELTYTPTNSLFMNRLSVGIRQPVRNGLYAGQIIEDIGITSDFVVRPRLSDILPNTTTNSQYDRISDSLTRIGEKNGKNKLHFVAEPMNIQTTVGPLSIKAEVAGIEEITVFKADGKTVAGQQTISPSDRNIQIEAPPVINGLGYSRITLVGKTAGKQVVKTYRNIRYIPKTSDFIPLVANPFTFSDITPAVGIYNGPQTLAASGWNKSGKYIIGNGIKYADNVDSSIEAFFTAPVGTHINIDLDLNLNSEPDYDFIYLTVNSMDGAKDFLLSSIGTDNKTVFNGVSGLNTTVKGVFPYVTKNEQFSVSLQFTSDGAVEFSGATINSFKINAQPSTTFRKEHGHSGRRAE
ncbi:hypothetical protein QVD99_004037 [Batrachochytrium dendrobatidis]|nr:hypothetical protein O5D80_005511 [Batrachochytrium dendrobatidis]KAK5669648.1 hypothetical protein QVD99_004037 [Batrachochytrium dendrobatidis]